MRTFYVLKHENMNHFPTTWKL